MATAVPPPSTPGVLLFPIQFAGQVAADTTAAARFKLPFPVKVLGVSVSARAKGGGDNTLAVDVKAGGTSLLSAPIAVTTGAVTEGAIAGAGRVADEAEITVDLDLGGTTPTFDDVSVLLTLARV